MLILMFGSGVIGSGYGYALAQAGVDVTACHTLQPYIDRPRLTGQPAAPQGARP